MGANFATWSAFVEHLSELTVLISLFTSGLKMSVGWREKRWLAPLRLALLSMLATRVRLLWLSWCAASGGTVLPDASA